MKTNVTVGLAIMITMLCVSNAMGQVANGSFEDGQFVGNYIALPGNSTAIPGWTTTDSGVEWFDPAAHGSTPAVDGRMVVDIANYTYSAGGLMQTMPTDPGSVYLITFSLGTQETDGRLGTCEIIVSADGQSQTFSATNHSAALAWETKTFEFTADDSTADLSFRCEQNANLYFAYIDGVGTDGTVTTYDKTWDEIKSLYR